VDDSSLVSGREPLRDLDRVIDRLANRQGSRRKTRPQRLAFQKLRDDVGRTFVRPDVVNGGDVGMVQAARGLRLLLEPAQPIGVLRERSGKHLDRHLAL